tara:strand:+ start:410 stop:1036 length:627 start_codon:yes stop_codon:yes gene_type:complete
MATYDIAFHTRLDNYAVLQTFVNTDIQTQDSVVVAGADHGFSGTHTVISTEPYLFEGVSTEGDLLFDYNVIMENQFIYKNVGDNYTRSVATGTVTYTPSPQWCSSADVESWLGIDVATANDTAFIAVCVSASNSWCYRKRREAGYTDSLSSAPDGAAKLGAINYAAMQYRSRGAVDGYSSFDSMGMGTPTMSLGQIMQLLGCGRPQVA